MTGIRDDSFPHDIEIEGCLAVRLLADNRVLTLQPLTFGRYRITTAAAWFGTPNVNAYDDGY